MLLLIHYSKSFKPRFCSFVRSISTPATPLACSTWQIFTGICVHVYLCICIFEYLCICVFEHLYVYLSDSNVVVTVSEKSIWIAGLAFFAGNYLRSICGSKEFFWPPQGKSCRDIESHCEARWWWWWWCCSWWGYCPPPGHLYAGDNGFWVWAGGELTNGGVWLA